MRKFQYDEPTDDYKSSMVITMTEEEIAKDYLPYWVSQMLQIGNYNEVSWENCLDDWITINYAWEVLDGC